MAACVLLVLAGNARLLRWFARQRGFWFAAGVVPLRLLYYWLNGVAAGIGWLRHCIARTQATGSRASVHSDRAAPLPPADSPRSDAGPVFRDPSQ